ncbi:MAG: hypothetical protein HZB59_03595 [Ignavibacteriales bacterium]|nr:hypothetical protein [Ignavibacteriales bacterium]
MPHSTVKIDELINDHSKCLEDWYRGTYAVSAAPGMPVAKMPDIKKIEFLFNEWFNARREQLTNLICIEWDYPSKRLDPKFQDIVQLTAALADYLVHFKTIIPAPFSTAVLLIQNGLDKLCKVL